MLQHYALRNRQRPSLSMYLKIKKKGGGGGGEFNQKHSTYDGFRQLLIVAIIKSMQYHVG